MKIDRVLLNQLKDKLMISLRYCETVYKTGFDSYDQFQSFNQMCANHVNMCNIWCKRLKPIVPFLQRNKYKIYNEFRDTCVYTVEILNNLLAQYQENYENSVEEAKLLDQIEKRCRLEHEINLEYSEYAREKAKADDAKKTPIGFRTAANTNIPVKSKRKTTRKKKTKIDE